MNKLMLLSFVVNSCYSPLWKTRGRNVSMKVFYLDCLTSVKGGEEKETLRKQSKCNTIYSKRFNIIPTMLQNISDATVNLVNINNGCCFFIYIKQYLTRKT